MGWARRHAGKATLAWALASAATPAAALECLVPVKGEGASLAKAPAKPEGAEWAPPAVVIDDIYWRADGRGMLEPGYTHVFVIPADGGPGR